MMSKKGLIGCILAGAMTLALAACGQQTLAGTLQAGTPQTETPQMETSQAETPQTETSQPQTAQDEMQATTLVVYYSASGRTKTVAEMIANTMGADTFEIVPTAIYSSEDLNWRDDNSRVSREHDDTSLRAVELVSSTVENWDAYDTVLIGYPIWWGIAAWPVDGFVSGNDFTGKTVIPFCTSSSSGMGESGKLLAELAGTGEWLEGQRFRSGASETDVIQWVNELNAAQSE